MNAKNTNRATTEKMTPRRPTTPFRASTLGAILLTLIIGLLPMAQAADGPDLVITGVQLVTQNPLVGSNVVFLVEIKNLGNGPAGPFLAQIEGELGGVGQAPVDSLDVGEAKNLFLQAPLGAPQETFTLIVDLANQVNESDKQNNFLQIQVAGQAQPQGQPQAYVWQLSEVLPKSTVEICLNGCAVSNTVDHTAAFPEDLSNLIAILGVASAELLEENVPDGLTFNLDVNALEAQIFGSYSNDLGLALSYALKDANAHTVLELTVLANLISGGQGGNGGFNPPPNNGGGLATLQFDAVVQHNDSEVLVAGAQILVNGAPHITPFAVQAALGAFVSLQAPATIGYDGKQCHFKEWRSNGFFLANNNPLQGTVDKTESLQAVFGTCANVVAPPQFVKVKVRAFRDGNVEILSPPTVMSITVKQGGNTSTIKPPHTLTLLKGASVKLIAPNKIGSSNPRFFVHWVICTNNVCQVATNQKTLNLNNLTGDKEVRAIYAL